MAFETALFQFCDHVMNYSMQCAVGTRNHETTYVDSMGVACARMAGLGEIWFDHMCDVCSLN